MIGFYNYTVILTYLSLCSGAVGIVLALTNHPTIAMYCLMLSGLCDGFDGTIARTRKQSTQEERNFGVQLDSLCDMVCFGVLPVCIGFVTMKQCGGDHSKTFMIFVPVMCMYLLASLIRLAYFNVLTETAPPKEGERRSFVGMPVTSISLIFPLIYMLRYIIGDFSKAMIPIIAVFFVVVSILYVIKIKIPKPTVKQILVMIVIGALELIAIVLLRENIIRL